LLVRPQAARLVELCLGENAEPAGRAESPERAESTESTESTEKAVPAAGTGHSAAELEAWLRGRVADRLGLPASVVDVTRPFASLGLDSRQAVALGAELGDLLGQEMPAATVFDHPTI